MHGPLEDRRYAWSGLHECAPFHAHSYENTQTNTIFKKVGSQVPFFFSCQRLHLPPSRAGEATVCCNMLATSATKHSVQMNLAVVVNMFLLCCENVVLSLREKQILFLSCVTHPYMFDRCTVFFFAVPNFFPDF